MKKTTVAVFLSCAALASCGSAPEPIVKSQEPPRPAQAAADTGAMTGSATVSAEESVIRELDALLR